MQRLPDGRRASPPRARATRRGRSWRRRSRAYSSGCSETSVPSCPSPSSRAPRRFPARDSWRGRAGRGLLEPQVTGPRRARTAPGMVGDDFGADLFRVAVRGHVGAGGEHLAAAGRDRDEAIERDRVAHRPGGDHDDASRRRTSARGEPRRHPRARRPKTRIAAAGRTETARYSGRIRPSGAERRPGNDPAPPAPRLVARPPKQGQHPAGEQRRRRAARSSASRCTRAAPGRSRARRRRSAPPADRRAGGRSRRR